MAKCGAAVMGLKDDVELSCMSCCEVRATLVLVLQGADEEIAFCGKCCHGIGRMMCETTPEEAGQYAVERADLNRSG